MESQIGFKPTLKVFLFWVIFLILYGLYKVFPVFPLSIICGTNESNFQHYKVTFFTMLILNAIEYLIYRKQIQDISGYWYIRLLVAVFAPWIVFLLWYLAPAIYGSKMPSIPLEVIYANIMTILSGYFAISFERNFANARFSLSLKLSTWALVVASLVLYLVFTFSHLPWADVFVEPQWR